jgi:6-phosphogluconolactonase
VLRRYGSLDELGRAAAEEVVRAAGDAVAARGRFTLALAGGETPRGLYRLLASPPYRARVDWSRAELFWGDERAVPPGDPGSNYRLAAEALLGPLALPERLVHRIQAEEGAEAAEAAAARYERELARAFGVAPGGPPPAFDLVLLGMGPDGHVASLFPGSPALEERRRWAVPAEGPPPWPARVTLTLPVLNAARRVLVLVAGSRKAEALARVREGPRESRRLPAQLLEDELERVTWLVDEAAAARLGPPDPPDARSRA